MKTLAIAIALLTATNAKSEEMADTTIVYNGHTVTITDESLNSETTGDAAYETQYEEWTISETFSLPMMDWITCRKGKAKSEDINKPRFDSKITGFYVGFNKAIDARSDNFDNDMGRSIEIGFTFVEAAKALNDNMALTAGFGLNWRNFKLTDDSWMQKRGGYVETSKVPEELDLEYSKLRVFGFNIPVVYEVQQKGGNGFHGYVGAAGDIRLAKRVVNIYHDENDKRQCVTKKGVRTLPVGCDIIAQVGYKNFAVYGKFSPIRLFEDGRGPIDQAMTVGLKWCW